MTARWTVYNDKDLWNLTATLDTPSTIKSLGVASFSSSKVILNSGSDQIHLNGNYTSEASPTIYSDIQGASDEIVIYRNGVCGLGKKIPRQLTFTTLYSLRMIILPFTEVMTSSQDH